MFSTPNFHIYNHQAQENRAALTARKPGISNPGRKPLLDRAVNEAKPLQSEAVKPKILNKSALSMKQVSPKNIESTWIADTFSFKNIEDTYEDILPKSQRLSSIDFAKFINPPTPPLPEKIEIDPMFLELPEETIFRFPDEIDLLEEPIGDADYPDFDFLPDASF